MANDDDVVIDAAQAEATRDVPRPREPAVAERANARGGGLGPAALLLAAATLAACGGGGGDAPAPAPSPGPPAPPAPVPPSISDAQAARFLLQAQFSAPDADIAAVKTQGYHAWLQAQFAAAPGPTGVAWLNSRGHDAITAEARYFWPQFGDFMIWNQLLAGTDQMRKRAALALSEFFVVSLNPIDGFYPPYMIAAYWDLLTANAFGNFRELLERITLNAAMGFFLNTKGNLKEDAASGRQPDENYAREVMQLFTIGLYELNADGSPKRDANGQPIETYGQDDITNLARVFTGWDYDFSRTTFTAVPWATYRVPSPHFAIDPMAFDAARHSNLEVRFLGTTIPAGTPGPVALRMALDTLFRHPNVGPFFGRQMIQRLVTSNPSPAYVQRVAAAFADNGAGVRGDLRAVWTAILTDDEARGGPDAAQVMRGKLREPVVRFVQWARTVGVHSTSGSWEVYDLSASDNGLGQSPLRSPSVFNFFRPGYVPPNTQLARLGAQAPEFQLHHETTTAGYLNFLEWMLLVGYNNENDSGRGCAPTYAEWLPLAHDLPALVARLNLALAADQLSAATLARLRDALATLNVSVSSPEAAKRVLLASACLLVLACPEYLIQK